jgi:hypothetical protein
MGHLVARVGAALGDSVTTNRRLWARDTEHVGRTIRRCSCGRSYRLGPTGSTAVDNNTRMGDADSMTWGSEIRRIRAVYLVVSALMAADRHIDPAGQGAALLVANITATEGAKR